jgi:hypothetical protein
VSLAIARRREEMRRDEKRREDLRSLMVVDHLEEMILRIINHRR